MPQTIAKTAKHILNGAMGRVSAISVEEAPGLVGSPDQVFVDLRGVTEQAKTDVIAGAVASSRGRLE